MEGSSEIHCFTRTTQMSSICQSGKADQNYFACPRLLSSADVQLLSGCIPCFMGIQFHFSV